MTVTNYFLTLVVLVNTTFQQQNDNTIIITGPEKVLSELKIALSSTVLNSYEAFTLYSETAQRLARRGNYKEADSLFSKADALTRFETDSSKVIEMGLSRANMYKEQGKYTIALQTYMGALDFYQECNDANAQVWIYSYLVEFYRATLNEDLCLKFIKEGEELITTNMVETRPQAHFLQAKSSYFLQFQESIKNITFEEKRAHFELALSMAVIAKDSYLIGLIQNGLGFLLMHNNPSESDEIEAYFESAKAHMLANERFRNYTSVLQNYSMYYTRSGHPEKAVDMTFEAIEFSKKNNWNSHLGDLYRLAGEVNYELGQFKESAEYLNEALEATKQSMDKTHSTALGELTATYEKAIAERKLSEQKTKTEIAQTQADNNKKALTTTAIISVIFLAIAIISAILYRRLKGANYNLLSQQEITRQTNAKLKDAVEQKTVLYKELNHRVQNNLTVLSSLIYLQEDGEKNESQRALYQTLRHRIQSMALVHQNLYQFDEALNINFQQYLVRLIPGISAAYSDDCHVTTTISCDNLILSIDEAVPMAMIVNELFTNSFKHAFIGKDKGKVQLWSATVNEDRVIHYRDDGSGLKEEIKDDQQPQRLGMLIVKLMVEQLKGKLIHEGNGNGVYFRIELPPQAI